MVTELRTLRIASRGSQLALWQSGWIRNRIQEFHEIPIEIDVIRTTGDRITDVPLSRIGDKGLFTKEIDDAVLDGSVDLAVHSLKDVPTRLPTGLSLAAIAPRHDPRDALIGRSGKTARLESLPAGARVGTSSLRRRAQLLHLRPDLEVVDLRGNLDTRLRKLAQGEYEAIILAAAGLARLGWGPRISEMLFSEQWLPAVGQGALGVVIREDDTDLRETLTCVHHAPTAPCVTAERSFLRSLEGGCQIPIGALATLLPDRTLVLHGFVADIDGRRFLRDQEIGDETAAEEIGKRLAGKLLGRGAGEILEGIRQAIDPPKVSPP